MNTWIVLEFGILQVYLKNDKVHTTFDGVEEKEYAKNHLIKLKNIEILKQLASTLSMVLLKEI